jgi:hypothetical protein
MRFASLVPIVSLLVLPAACGSSSSSSSASSGTTTSSGGACPDNLAKAGGSEFCAKQATETNCDILGAGYRDQVCGVAVRHPTADLARSSGLKEFSGTGAPDLACYDASKYPAKPGTSQTVKMKGVAKIFSNGCESSGLTIEVYTVKRTGGADDGDIDQLIGKQVVTAADCTTDGVPETVASGKCSGTRNLCNYSYDGIPTETELLIKTSGPQWAPLYDFNIYAKNDEVKGGVWSHDVRALASDDYTLIPQVAFGNTIKEGNGAIAGEVHDCGDVRLTNATVDVSVDKAVLTYFTNDQDAPLPDLSNHATSKLGLYAAFDMKPGPVSVAAIGTIGGKSVTAGYFRARIFPDAVSAVTFRGVRPFQVP